MKTVFALVSLFVAVQAIPQAAGDAPPALMSPPACLSPCTDTLNKGTCASAKGADALARCFCQHSTEILGCAATACAKELPSLIGQQSAADAACSALLAGPPASAEASATPTGDAAKGTGSAAAGAGSASGSESAADTAAPTAADTAMPTGGEAAPTGGEAAPTGGEAASGTAAGTAAATGTVASATASATGAAGRVAVGGSVILAGLAAVLAL